MFILFSLQNPRLAFKAATGMRRRSPRRPRRVQTPRPRRRSPDPVDSVSSGEELHGADIDPNRYRHSAPAVPARGSYPPLPTHPRIPSVTTGTTTAGPFRTPAPSSRLRPESRRRSSQGSSGLTYMTDDPVIHPLPPGFVPYPGQDPVRRQKPFPTPHVPFQQSPLHPAPVPPPPQMQHHRYRAPNNTQPDRSRYFES